ncbi:MAG: copper ion binding protein [Pirellulaceae bacterium]|nr:copper ion binding protein [Pirellulaceae bacterium]
MSAGAISKTSLICPSCGTKGKRVGLATLRALLKEEFAHEVVGGEQASGEAKSNSAFGCSPTEGDTGWRFCNSQACDVVYVSETSNRTFRKSHLRVVVGVKENTGDRPLCYCFGHSVASIKEELRTKGRSDALDDIRAKMKDPGCRCETENPFGACCLGSVTKGIQIAQEELGMTTAPAETEPVQTAEDIPSSAASSRSSTGRGEKVAKIGTVVSAIMASACCWLPLALLAVGVSGVGIAATLETYRPLFIVVTFGFLAAAFYFTYRPKKVASDPGHGCCAPEPAVGGNAEADCCAPAQKGRFSMVAMNKIMLWGVTVLAVAFLLFPHYVGALLGTAGGHTAVVTPDMNRAVLQIEGMTCQGCEAVAEKAIRTVPGVLAVEVSYEKRQAVVGVDRSRDIPRDAILAALEKVSYQGRFVEAPLGLGKSTGGQTSLSTVALSVSGMTCPACAVSVQSALTKLPGVKSARVDAKTGEALVQFDAEQVQPEGLARAVTNVGFESSVKKNEN